MPVKVLSVREGRGLDPRNNVIRTITLTYMVGDHGPFTETGTPEELKSGAITQRINQFAATVAQAVA